MCLCVSIRPCRVRTTKGFKPVSRPVRGSYRGADLSPFFIPTRLDGGITHPSGRCNRPTRINSDRAPQECPAEVLAGSGPKWFWGWLINERLQYPAYIAGEVFLCQ